MTNSHICSACSCGFETNDEYLDHTCTTGFTPRDVEHQDALTNGQFSMQSAEALKRGEERVEAEK